MVTVILPGYSIKNKEWASESSKELDLGHEIRPIFWDHWTDPEKIFKAKEKSGDIIDVLLHDSANIVAKSIGSLVAAYVMQAIPARIEKVIFCGIPLNDLNEADKELIKEALRRFPAEKILCFQNEDDPHGSFDQIKDFLAKINPQIKIISKDRSDHEYPYYKEFQEFLSS